MADDNAIAMFLRQSPAQVARHLAVLVAFGLAISFLWAVTPN
jgi:hypothetical protein